MQRPAFAHLPVYTHGAARPPGLTAALAAMLLGWAAGCDGSPPPTPTGTAQPAHDTAAAIPNQPLAGALRSRPFAARDARYRVDRRPGHEKLDILLSDATAEHPCGDLHPAEPARIWLRRPGAEPAGSVEVRIDAEGEGEWTAHYQLRQEGRWVGNGRAGAVLRLDIPDGGYSLTGALSVCFADGAESCAAGTFTAHRCPSEVTRPVRGLDPTETPAALARPPSDTGQP